MFSVGPMHDPAYPEGSFLVTVTGNVDVQSAEPFRAAVAGALAERPAELVIDLRDTTYLDASGVEVLVQSHGVACESETRMKLIAGSSEVMTPLEMSGALALFDVV